MATLRTLIYSWIDKFFLKGCSSYNPLVIRKSCRKKSQARLVFAKNNIPHAKGLIFFWPLTAHRFALRHGFPLVIKPNVSGFSRGSYFPINNFFELWWSILLAKCWWPTTVVEQYLDGKNYRVTVCMGKIMSVIRRYPPFIVGDSLLTIQELIKQENATRKKMALFPVIHPIPINNHTRQYLKRQGLHLESIPSKGQRIILNSKIALAPGGVVETIDQSDIPQENKELFLKILKLFKANILGIDVIMSKGIDSDYRQQDCIFLEVNSRPFLAMHQFPRFGRKENLTPYLDELNTINIADADIF